MTKPALHLTELPRPILRESRHVIAGIHAALISTCHQLVDEADRALDEICAGGSITVPVALYEQHAAKLARLVEELKIAIERARPGGGR